MRIVRDIKEIPNGYYYVQVNGFYVIDRKPVVLEYLESLFSLDSANAYALKTSKGYYVFLLEEGRIVERENIDDLFLLYPDMVVEDVSNIKKSPVKVKGVKIRLEHLAVAVVVAAVVGGGILYVKNIKESKPKVVKKVTNVVEKVVKKECMTNVPSFLRNYIPYAQVEDGKVYVEVAGKRYEAELKEEKAKPVEVKEIFIPSIEYEMEKGIGGYEVRIGDYYSCIGFINQNKIPLKIRRIRYEKGSDRYACELFIPEECISTGVKSGSAKRGTSDVKDAKADRVLEHEKAGRGS